MNKNEIRDEILSKFMFNAPNSQQIKIMNEIRSKVLNLIGSIISMCPDGREKSLTITKLEECSMWANKSITHNKWNKGEKNCEYPNKFYRNNKIFTTLLGMLI